MNKLEECQKIANEKFQGHMTIMKFSTNWKFCFGTPTDPLIDSYSMYGGETLEEALEKGIREQKPIYEIVHEDSLRKKEIEDEEHWRSKYISFIASEEKEHGEKLIKNHNSFISASIGIDEKRVIFFDSNDAWHYCKNLNIDENKAKSNTRWQPLESTVGEIINAFQESGVISQDGRIKNEVDFLKKILDNYKNNQDLSYHYRSSYRELQNIIVKAEKEHKHNKDKYGYVYFMKIKGQNLVKIGVSKRPPKRKAQLETKMPFEIEIINKIKCTNPYELEKEYHEQYKEKRVNGEWFEMSQNDIKNILKINKTA